MTTFLSVFITQNTLVMDAIGIDIGYTKSILSFENGDLILTETGGISRPSLVGFFGASRLVGEEAAAQSSSSSTVGINFSLIGKSGQSSMDDNILARFQRGALSICPKTNLLIADITYNGSVITIPSTALLGMFLARQEARIFQITGSSACYLAFVLPPRHNLSVPRAITEACMIANIDPNRCFFCDKTQALLSAYKRKVAGAHSSGQQRNVLMAEIGAINSTFILIADNPSSISLKSYSHLDIGGAIFDACLYDYFCSSLAAKMSAFTPISRKGERLRQGCERLKKLLSQLSEASVTVENMSDCGDDIVLSLSRAELAIITADPLRQIQESVILAVTAPDVIVNGGEDKRQRESIIPVHCVELLGGGGRMPAVQACVQAALVACGSTGSGIALGARFDDNSAAVGAAILGSLVKSKAQSGAQMDAPASPLGSWTTDASSHSATCGLSPEDIESLKAQEQAWQQNDALLVRTLACRNAIEAMILSYRAAALRHPKSASLLPPPNELSSYLSEQEDWLHDNQGSDFATVEAKEAHISSYLKSVCGAFLAAVELDKVAKAEQHGKAIAADTNEPEQKVTDRLRLAQKNLIEAQELLQVAGSELHFRAATARFNKALSHAMSVPVATGILYQLPALKFKIYSGLSDCYKKSGNVDLAITNATLAIEACPKEWRGLMTRSELLASKEQWEPSLKDAKAAIAICKTCCGDSAVSANEFNAVKIWANKLEQRVAETKKLTCIVM